MAQAGNIALFPFPQTTLVARKLRPTLLLKQFPNTYDDWLVCMISSQLHQNIVGLDDLVSTTATDFAQTGLTKESIIRVSRIAIVSQSIFLGKIGDISPQRLAHIKTSLAN
jgi:mRNA interferase MazF